MKEVCKALQKRKEILACEYLDRKRVFGDKASLDEMSSFKSRVKQQEPIYDPDVEKAKEQERKEREREEAKRRKEEEE